LSAGTDKPDYRYLLTLSGVGVILQTLAWTISPFPFFQFFAFVPVIAVCLYLNKVKNTLSPEIFGTVFFMFLIPALFKFLVFTPSFRDFIASLSPAFTFLLWFYSGTRLGRLKSIYLLIFWLGIEYIFIAISPPIYNHLPAAAFRLWGESLTWIRFTGFQGTTIWILLTNILFTTSFFDENGKLPGKILRARYLISSAVGILPMVVSMLFYSGDPEGDLTGFFTNPSGYWNNFSLNPFYSYYLDFGEYLGKTSFWLSILILLSLMVKNYLSKNGN